MNDARHAAVLLAATFLAACASGPEHRPPAMVLDAEFVQRSGSAEPVAEFWRGFNDDQLNALIARALESNGDVLIARARLQEARANAGEADANRLPTFGANAGVARVEQAGTPGSANQFSAGADFNWELDFFGRTRRASESAAALVQAGEAGVHAAQRLVSAEVASNYLNLRGLQQRLRVAQEALVNQRETLRIVQARSDLGRGTPLDAARAQALVDSTEASIPALQAAIDRSAYRLATLSGQTPRATGAALAEAKLLPMLATTDLATLGAGTPQTLLQRRPDIRIAERQLAAATANVDVARADLYPRIRLTGLLGFTSNRLSELLQSDSHSSSLGAGLTWTALDFGRTRSRIAANEARAEQALRVWEQTVQLALEETEGALAQYSRNAQQTAKLESAAQNSEQAARLARIRFEGGAADFLTVLDAERSVLAARDALVQAQVGTTTALVAVYRALGGGWTATR